MLDDCFPQTQQSMISVMLQRDDNKRLVALGCFYERYRPGLARVLQAKLRLQPTDTDEILNEFMVQKLMEGSFLQKYVAWRDVEGE